MRSNHNRCIQSWRSDLQSATASIRTPQEDWAPCKVLIPHLQGTRSSPTLHHRPHSLLPHPLLPSSPPTTQPSNHPSRTYHPPVPSHSSSALSLPTENPQKGPRPFIYNLAHSPPPRRLCPAEITPSGFRFALESFVVRAVEGLLDSCVPCLRLRGFGDLVEGACVGRDCDVMGYVRVFSFAAAPSSACVLSPSLVRL